MRKNGSLAVWCKSRAEILSPNSFEAHFNYWRLAGDKRFRRNDGLAVVDFFEIGVFVLNPSSIEGVYIFLPLHVNRTDIFDCSMLLNDVHIAQGIFNEVLCTSGPAIKGPHFIKLDSQDNKVFCRIHVFATANGNLAEHELGLEKLDDGTVLFIEGPSIKDFLDCSYDAPAYFRIRVGVAGSDNPFVRVIAAPDQYLQSGYGEIEYLDFRVNEARTLPQSVEQKMRLCEANGPVHLQVIAVLTAIPVNSELSISNTPSHKMRLLEHDLWSKYVAGGLPQGMVVYHWKKDAGNVLNIATLPSTLGITDFTAFVKLQTRRSGWRTQIIYLLVVFFVGVFGSVVASLITNTFSAPADCGSPGPVSEAACSTSTPHR